MRDDCIIDDLRLIRGVRVFFGHHSVGRDILDGLFDIARRLRSHLLLEGAPLGKNGDPLGKISDFEHRAQRERCDVAMMKLCYVDVRPDTNVDAIVDAYARSVARLRAARPGMRIIHVTPPLHARQMDLKARANRMLGRVVWEDHANKKRLELADELRAAFPREPFFDLARTESTRLDGTREIHVVDDRQVPMLWPGFTVDGGHLNAAGKRAAASAFVRAVADAVR